MDGTDKPATASEDQFALAHEILVLDAYLKRPLNCEQREPITRCFMSELLAILGLEPLGPLAIFPAADQRAPGWSFIQPITTSHVSAHYFEKPGPRPHIRIDAYSCEAIDWRRLIGHCHEHFSLDRWRASFIDRQIDSNSKRMVLDLSGYGPNVSRACPLIEAQTTGDDDDYR